MKPTSRSTSTASVPIGETRADLFGLVPDLVRREIEACTRRRRYQAGRLIYTQDTAGTEMYRIVSGAVRLYHLGEDGREFVHAVYEPGYCFGVSSLIDGLPRAQMAQAQVDTVVEVLTQVDFDELRRRHPSFDRALVLVLIGDVRNLINRVKSVAIEPLPSRLAWRILKTARSEGDGRWVARLPQAELAAMVDASRQRVNVILQAFQEAGLIELEYGGIAVIDRGGLSRRITKP
jgi:CRP/FNR family transcriptional regulator, cyclic AMP receptor protein